MEIKQGIGVLGTVTITKYRGGEIVEQQTIHNIVTNYELGFIASILTGTLIHYNSTLTLPTIIELGTGTGTPAVTDTDLYAYTTPRTTGSVNSPQVWLNTTAQWTVTWLSGTLSTSTTWTEAGLKDVDGNLWAHVVFTVGMTVNAGEVLSVQWQQQFIAAA